MGSILTSVFTIIFSRSLPLDNLNVENMFFTLGALSAINFVVVMKKMSMGMSASPVLGNEVPALDKNCQ
ncbi:hypothetical protein GN958_ATG08328 [Phytophthora infestans]|nr:hypothetical protein GN958_ATG08328 [Phytophthora infestans]